MNDPDFIYWRHPTVPGIKVEEVSGGDIYSGATWLEMARQVYCENGRDAYRDLGHFRNGAPFLYGEQSRISVTHCRGLFVVATLPPTPEVDLAEFSERAAMGISLTHTQGLLAVATLPPTPECPLEVFAERTALGIDAERADRSQVLKIRGRFLSDEELALVPADDVTANVIAWTVKEAAYKAAMTEGLDFRDAIRIRRMPRPAPPVPVFAPREYGLGADVKDLPGEFFGEVAIVIPCVSDRGREPGAGGGTASLSLSVYTYMSDDCVVTLCYSPRCAKFGKSGQS